MATSSPEPEAKINTNGFPPAVTQLHDEIRIDFPDGSNMVYNLPAIRQAMTDYQVGPAELTAFIENARRQRLHEWPEHINAERAQAAGRRMAEQVERVILGEPGFLTYGGHTISPAPTVEDILAMQRRMLDQRARTRLVDIVPANDHERFAVEILKNGANTKEFAAYLDDVMEKVVRPEGFVARAELEEKIAVLERDNNNLKGSLYSPWPKNQLRGPRYPHE